MVTQKKPFARVTDCDLTLLTVIEDVVAHDNIPDTPLYQERKKKAEQLLQDAAKRLERHGVWCRTRIAIGPIASEIVRIGKEGAFDIIFVGSRGLGGIKRMLVGSVADDVIRNAHCSVTLVR